MIYANKITKKIHFYIKYYIFSIKICTYQQKMLPLHTNLITNNFNNNFNMFAKINTRESDATYFDKVNLLHYNDSNIIKIDIDDGRNKLFKICEIISRLNDFTEAERRVYYCINTLGNITVSEITKHITSIYGYSVMTVKRSLDKFIQCGVIAYENKNNSREVNIKLNNNFNAVKYVEDNDSDILIAVNLKLYNI